MAPVALRHRAAVEALDLAGREHVLEIGCGHGVATRLILDRLTTGTIVALDRSQKMIDLLTASTPEAIASGKLVAEAQAIETACLPKGAFDRIVAINLDLNLRLGATWPGLLKPLLRKRGWIVLAFDAPPDPNKPDSFAARTSAALEANGFEVTVRGIEGVTVLAAH